MYVFESSIVWMFSIWQRITLIVRCALQGQCQSRVVPEADILIGGLLCPLPVHIRIGC